MTKKICKSKPNRSKLAKLKKLSLQKIKNSLLFSSPLSLPQPTSSSAPSFIQLTNELFLLQFTKNQFLPIKIPISILPLSSSFQIFGKTYSPPLLSLPPPTSSSLPSSSLLLSLLPPLLPLLPSLPPEPFLSLSPIPSPPSNLEFLTKFCESFNLPPPSSSSPSYLLLLSSSFFLPSPCILPTSLSPSPSLPLSFLSSPPPSNLFTFPETYHELVKKIKNKTTEFREDDCLRRVLVFGNKNSGKSTISNFILNSLTSSFKNVYLLETDLGQSSFYLPGFVSLFQFKKGIFETDSAFCPEQPKSKVELKNMAQFPLEKGENNLSIGSNIRVITNSSLDEGKDKSFLINERLRLKKPIISFFCGEFSPINGPSEYLISIKKALNFYQNLQPAEKGPLIINTHGFINNLGENLLFDLIHLTQAFWLVGMGQLPAKVLDFMNGRSTEQRISFLEEEYNSKKRFEFVHLLREESGANKSRINFAKKRKRDLTLLAYLSAGRLIDQVKIFKNPPETIEIFDFVPANWVFDLHSIHFFALENQRLTPLYTSKQIITILPFSLLAFYDQTVDNGNFWLSNCVGVGYVKDVDPNKGLLYLVTPINEEIRRNIKVAVRSGEFGFSNAFYKDNRESSANIREMLEVMGEEQDLQYNQPFLMNGYGSLGGLVYTQKVSTKK